MKCFYFDTETTGLHPWANDIVHLAYILEIDGDVVETDLIKCQPHDPSKVKQEALDVNGLTMDEIMAYPTPKEAHERLLDGLGKHIDKFNKMDKAWQAGYNVFFDQEMLSAWFKKCGDHYYGSWFNGHTIDPRFIMHWLVYHGHIQPLENYKLATVCEHFEIKLEAHKAMSDITATRELVHLLAKTL